MTFYLRPLPRPEQETIATDDMIASLPEGGRKRIEESQRQPVVNPLVDHVAKEALSIVAHLAEGYENLKASYNSSRSTLRAICDFFFDTGKDEEFLTVDEAIEALDRAISDHPAQLLLDDLYAAGMIEISDLIPDSETPLGMLERLKRVVTLTDRGKTMLDIRNQPAVLLAP